jgi:hypothetical protein
MERTSAAETLYLVPPESASTQSKAIIVHVWDEHVPPVPLLNLKKVLHKLTGRVLK